MVTREYCIFFLVETSVEKPIDMMPAAEVEEELETGEAENDVQESEVKNYK